MITVNGEACEFCGQSVSEIIAEYGLDPLLPGIAVAVNGAVVPRADWPSLCPKDNTWVEIVRAKTGG